MALFKFTKAMLEGQPIEVFNDGNMARDFTYIDDLVACIMRLADVPPGRHPVGAHDTLSPAAPFRVVNIGAGKPIGLMAFIAALEAALGITAQKSFTVMQPGDMRETWADDALLNDLVGPMPHTPVATGVRAFVDWYRKHYQVMS